VGPCLRRWRSLFGPRCATGSLRWLFPPAHPSQPWPYSLRSHGKLRRPPSGRPPRALWSMGEVASAPCVWWLMESQGQLRLRRAGSESIGGCRSSRGSRVVGFSPVVAVAGRVALLAWHRRRPGTCRGCNRRQCSWMLNLTFACCTPGRTLVGLRLPGEESDPTSAGALCAALGSGSGPAPSGSRCEIHHSETLSGSGGVPAVSLAVKFHIDCMPVVATQLINDRRAQAVPRSDVLSGNLLDHRFVDQVGGAASPGARCEIPHRPRTRWPHG